jgi:flagellin
MATRNANDGISLIRTVENALVEVSGMLQRMRVLAVQSANDTNTVTERAFANNELDQLQLEISRVSLNTRYNGAQVLNGSFSAKSLQVGTESGESLSFSIANVESNKLGAFVKVGTLRTAIRSTTANTPLPNGILANGTLEVSGNGGPWSVIVHGAGSTAKTIAKRINAVAGATQVSAEARTYAHLYATGTAVNHRISLNGVQTAAFALTSSDVSDAVQKINAISATSGIQATATSDYKILLSHQTGDDIKLINQSANNDLYLRTVGIDGIDLTGSNPINILQTGNDANAGTVAGGIRLTSNNDFTVKDVTSANFFGTTVQAAPLVKINQVNVLTRISSTDALAVIDGAIARISSERGSLGTLENRLDYTVSNLMKVTEYTTGARSRVEDADFAVETSRLAKAQVLQQAAAAMLTQANASTDTVLQLIRG